MERHSRVRDSRGWVVALIVLGGTIAWWVMSHSPREPAAVSDSAGVPSIVEAPQSWLGDEAAKKPSIAGRLAGAGRAAPANCVDQHLDITTDDEPQRSCVSRTQVIQNGNVRTYRVESQGGAVSSAHVDAAGERVLRAEVTIGAGEAFSCSSGRCPGISFGPYDSQGARQILFEKARLSRTVAPGDHANVEAEESVLVTGQLRTIPDDQLSSSTCAGQVLLVSRGPGTLHFCPDSGSGYDLDEDGGTTFRFTNNDGTTLAVSVNSSGALKRVALGKHECRAPACSGVTIGAVDAAGSRRFSFSGTSLLEAGGESQSAVLNGAVMLPPL